MTSEVKDILKSIKQTRHLHNELQYCVKPSKFKFIKERLKNQIAGMSGLNEFFEKTDKWNQYFWGHLSRTIEVRTFGNRDKQNR